MTRESFPLTRSETRSGSGERRQPESNRCDVPLESGRPDSVELVVHGEPKGKARARFNRATGTAYTPTATQRAEQRIQQEWIHAGRPTVDGPLAIDIEIVLARPQNHFKGDGSLGAAGERAPWPTKRPDWDNVSKLVADSLNGLAYRDDAQIVWALTRKRWADMSERERTVIRLSEMAVERTRPA